MKTEYSWIIFVTMCHVITSVLSCQSSEAVNFSRCPDWPERVEYEEHNGPIILRCNVQPETANVTWLHNGSQMSNRHVAINRKGQELRIQDPVLQDTGNYTCVAMVNNSVISYSGYFRVKESSSITRPRIINTSPLNLQDYVILGTSTNISCTFDVGTSSDPFGSQIDLMQWRRNGTLVNDTTGGKTEYQHSQNEEEQQTLILTIRNITENDFGQYECFAQNGYGSTSQNITLLQSVSPQHSGTEDPPWFMIIAVSSGVGFVVIALFVSVVILVYRRKRGEPGWEDPDLEHYEVPVHAIEYDVFISYSSEDENWVKGTLFENLIQKGYNVNIDFKDFVPGMAIAENIMDSIYKSRKTVFVMSKNFLKSMWGQFELQQAHNRAISQRKDVLILIKFESCKVPAKLMGKTFLDYTDKAIKPHFWKRFYDSLGNPGEGLQKVKDNAEIHLDENEIEAEHHDNAKHENHGDYNHVIVNLKNEKNKMEGINIADVNLREKSHDHCQRLVSTESCESQDSCVGRRISLEERKPLLV